MNHKVAVRSFIEVGGTGVVGMLSGQDWFGLIRVNWIVVKIITDTNFCGLYFLYWFLVQVLGEIFDLTISDKSQPQSITNEIVDPEKRVTKKINWMMLQAESLFFQKYILTTQKQRKHWFSFRDSFFF